MDIQSQIADLKTRLTEIEDLRSASAVLSWDRATYMPPGGAAARGRQSALLARLRQEKLNDPALGRLLDALQPHGESLPYDSAAAAMLRLARREYDRAQRVPPAFVAQLHQHLGESFAAWRQARPENNFALVRPYLEKTVELSRQYAAFFPEATHPADPFIEQFDYGLNTATVRAVFAELREQLVPLVQALTAQPPADDSCLLQTFPMDQQWSIGLEASQLFGYDMNRGRQDQAPHPFMTSFSIGDVRITTRLRADVFSDAFYSTLHETGHALYEQGVAPELEGTPLAGGASAGMHESQSRLWENLVGRSRAFCEFFYPRLQHAFPAQLGTVPLDTFYRAINKVQRSLIRTDADEVTYNLHVIVRFDLELALLEGQLAVRDLPEAWHARYQSDLGVRAPSDSDGVLQDMHWFYSPVGGRFQGYTLGNMMSAQIFDAASRAIPSLPADIQRGHFTGLRQWLTENVYRHGKKFTAAETLHRATGQPLQVAPYIRYLRQKYGELYAV